MLCIYIYIYIYIYIEREREREMYFSNYTLRVLQLPGGTQERVAVPLDGLRAMVCTQGN